MANEISPDMFASAVNDILSEFREVTQEALKEATDEVAKETKARLKATSPSRTGKYAKSWTYSTKKNGNAYGKVIYSKEPSYRLTHLLEYGHALVRGGRTVGRAKAHPHISKAEQQAIDEFERRLLDKL